MSRRAVLVTTGRLVGAAAADAQEYKNFLNERGEISFDVWDQEDLRYWLIHDPSCGLAGGIAGDLLAVIVAAEQGLICQQQLERYTRQWTSIPLHRAAIEAAVIANKLRDCRRADLAAITALCVLRAARSQDSYPDAGLFLGATDEHVAEEARSAVMTIVSKQPGMERPPSDRWAVSLMCASLAAYPNSPAKVADLLENAIIWTVDYYDGRPGLAPVDCAELEEIEYLMGFPLSHVELRNRRSSYLATMLIDLCAFFGFKKLYEAALNDFYAVNVVPTMISADERLARWGAGEFGISLVNHVRYQRRWNSDAVLASHHRTRPAEDIPAWDALALACLPRNRHPFWAFGEVCRL